MLKDATSDLAEGECGAMNQGRCRDSGVQLNSAVQLCIATSLPAGIFVLFTPHRSTRHSADQACLAYHGELQVDEIARGQLAQSFGCAGYLKEIRGDKNRHCYWGSDLRIRRSLHLAAS